MTANKIPATLIKAFKASQTAHSVMRGSFKTNKLRKTASVAYEAAVQTYREELFAFTGVDDQNLFNATVESLYATTR